jgi:hypothetical protein
LIRVGIFSVIFSELENVKERAVIMSENDIVELSLPLSNTTSNDFFSDKPTLDEL